MRSLLLLALAIPAIATPKEERAAGPAVKIKDGTVVGTSSGGVDSFKGIPFAEPPVGDLRLKPPHPLTKSFGTIKSQRTPTACPQFLIGPDTKSLPKEVAGLLLNSPLVQAATKAGEDCLTLNVQRPSNATPKSKLPVLFWIFGGGFEVGSTQMYDGSGFVKKSTDLGKDIIYVAVNYRVGGFGFLAGDDLTKEGSTNLGLRDQRAGMQWVQDNIAAFGGDPEKVTIWGESAGAISVFDHTIINGGDNTYKGKRLFRAAIMNSGSIVPTLQTNSSKANAVYEKVVATAGCDKAADKLACLRKLPYTKFLNAVTSQPGIFSYDSVDLAYLPRPDPTSDFFRVTPENSVLAGKFTRVPIIIGDQEDEGPLFSLTQSNVSSTEDLITYFKSYFPTAKRSTVAKLVRTYPDEPSAGSPFNTGPLNNIYPQYKRLAALLGDSTFTLTRRIYLSVVSKSVPSWSYVSSYFYGTPILGTFHGSDILTLYLGLGSPVAAESIKTYYISFVNTLDPNTLATKAPTINWPRWTNKGKQLLHFQTLSNALLKDDFREKSYQQLVASAGKLRV